VEVSGKKSKTIFYLFLSILHYFREYLLKIGDNSGMKHRLDLTLTFTSILVGTSE